MKPDWDKLMTKFADHATILVGDVDCTTEGKPLCDGNGVKGFPTIKHGDPANLEDYNGGRDYASLEKFASSLKPVCSPANIDLCDAEGKANIEKIQALSDEELSTQIAALEKKGTDAETTFKTELAALQARYQELQEEQDAAVAAIKESGLALIKSVQAARKKKPAKEEL